MLIKKGADGATGRLYTVVQKPHLLSIRRQLLHLLICVWFLLKLAFFT
jgi:hypothetical protein